MKRIVLAALVAASTIAIPSTVSAGEAIPCGYDATSHQITQAITGDHSILLSRDIAGHILLNGFWCDNVATVTNTDSILVTGDDVDSQAVQIDLANKGFRPGLTNEAGKSDEIEFTINLGGGSDDTVLIAGADVVDKIDLGQSKSIFGVQRRVNFNAGEKTGIDADIAMINVEHITIDANGGNDIVRARGKAGTGPNAVTLPLSIYGGAGNDLIKGGDASDQLYGDAGIDTMYGFGSGDTFSMADGESGDVGYGGAGLDQSFSDLGDTFHQD